MLPNYNNKIAYKYAGKIISIFNRIHNTVAIYDLNTYKG